jgi:hypothetical protein
VNNYPIHAANIADGFIKAYLGNRLRRREAGRHAANVNVKNGPTCEVICDNPPAAGICASDAEYTDRIAIDALGLSIYNIDSDRLSPSLANKSEGASGGKINVAGNGKVLVALKPA